MQTSLMGVRGHLQQWPSISVASNHGKEHKQSRLTMILGGGKTMHVFVVGATTVGTTVIMKNGGVSWIASGIRMAISEPKLLIGLHNRSLPFRMKVTVGKTTFDAEKITVYLGFIFLR